MHPPLIRPATGADLPAINDIYNFYVLSSTCTYQEEPETLDGRQQWFAAHGAAHPVLVAELNGNVVGWGALSPFHPRSAYRYTVEDAIYIRHDLHRRGIGRLLLNELIERAKSIGHHSIVALISAEQAGSLGMHKQLGFNEVGRLRDVGRKFNQWLDLVYLQLSLDSAKSQPRFLPCGKAGSFDQ